MICSSILGWKPSEPRATIFGGAPEAVIVVGPGNTIPEFNPALLTLGDVTNAAKPARLYLPAPHRQARPALPPALVPGTYDRGG